MKPGGRFADAVLKGVGLWELRLSDALAQNWPPGDECQELSALYTPGFIQSTRFLYIKGERSATLQADLQSESDTRFEVSQHGSHSTYHHI